MTPPPSPSGIDPPAVEDDVQGLRRALGDMAALSSLPALWLNADHQRIAETLVQALHQVLETDAVRIDLAASAGQLPVLVSAGAGPLGDILRGLEPADLDPALGPRALPGGSARLYCVGVGLTGSVLSVACRRAEFPTEAERLTIAMSANQAAVAMQRVRAEQALRAQTEALNRERDAVASLNRIVANERDSLRRMFEQAPGFMAVLKGPDHVFSMCNASYFRLVGERQIIGRPVRQAFPDLEGQGFFELLDEAYVTGQAYLASAAPIDIARRPGAPPERRYIDFIYQPMLDEDGQVSGIFAEGHDVTEQALAAQHRQLLVNELNHRVKNTLATVQAITHQTLRGFGGLAHVEATLNARLVALSAAHDILTRENWAGAQLAEIVKQALSPHQRPDRARLRIKGPAVALEPRIALALSMALHELATNAAKYGALSTDGGCVTIAWNIEAGRRVRLAWRETGGPPIHAPPTRRGFGSRVLLRALGAELGEAASLDFRPGGLVCSMSWPLTPTLEPDISEPLDRTLPDARHREPALAEALEEPMAVHH